MYLLILAPFGIACWQDPESRSLDSKTSGALLAQPVERVAVNLKVDGSIPSWCVLTFLLPFAPKYNSARLAVSGFKHVAVQYVACVCPFFYHVFIDR